MKLDNRTKAEVIWVIAVVAILSWAAVSNATYLQTHSENIANPVGPDPQGVIINVTGYQWAWAFQYPNGTISTDKLVLTNGTTYTLIVSSKDVIHDLYIPEFGVNIYAVYGHTNQITFKPTKAGIYLFECVEYCGEFHYEMRGTVVVT